MIPGFNWTLIGHFKGAKVRHFVLKGSKRLFLPLEGHKYYKFLQKILTFESLPHIGYTKQTTARSCAKQTLINSILAGGRG